eukprot:4071304-Amphidinium_carterae.1
MPARSMGRTRARLHHALDASTLLQRKRHLKTSSLTNNSAQGATPRRLGGVRAFPILDSREGRLRS